MKTFDEFMEFDIRVGEIIKAEPFPEARKPAYKLTIDFGAELGERRSSAQITEIYTAEELVGKQILAVVNFPPRKVASFVSEVLVLGVYNQKGVILVQPERPAALGERLG